MNTAVTLMLVGYPAVLGPYISYNNGTITKEAHPVLIHNGTPLNGHPGIAATSICDRNSGVPL